jgi:hypothetical protein
MDETTTEGTPGSGTADERTALPADGELEASPPRPRATGPMHEGGPIAIAIGIASAIGFASLAFLLAFAFFAAVAIYALVKAIGDEGSGNPVVVVLITLLLLTTFVALLCVGIGKLGTSLTPKKRRRD